MARTRWTVALTVVATAITVAVPMSVPAAAQTVSDPIAEGLAGPLGLAAGSGGTVYVAQSFSGTLTAVDKKRTTDLVSAPGTGIAGVDATGKGTVTYATEAAWSRSGG